MTIDKVLYKNTQALCFLQSGKLVCYQPGYILLLCNGIIEKRIPIPLGKKEKILGGNRILSRFFRFGVRTAISINESDIILNMGNVLFELNTELGSISNGFVSNDGARPLILTFIDGVKGFKDGIYFGGYLGNVNKKPVRIYRRESVDHWEVVYTFPQGAINHVHNLVADPYRNCLWAFTGDFDESAAIWKITDDFGKVERILCNNQKYRGCVAYALPEGLLYATDAPFADNYIYMMNTDNYEVKEVFPMGGSCIYGCKWKDRYVFSSTVEGDGRNMSRMEWLFTRKRGAGIKDNYVHMYVGNLQEGFKEIYKEKKDGMPFYTFQFGVFKFPNGKNDTDTLYFYPVATKKNDLNLLSFKI